MDGYQYRYLLTDDCFDEGRSPIDSDDTVFPQPDPLHIQFREPNDFRKGTLEPARQLVTIILFSPTRPYAHTISGTNWRFKRYIGTNPQLATYALMS